MSSMIAVTIELHQWRSHKHQKLNVFVQQEISEKNVALVNDIVTLKIVNHLNGTIHATIK